PRHGGRQRRRQHHHRHRHCRRLMAVTSSPSPVLPSPPRLQPPHRHLQSCTAVTFRRQPPRRHRYCRHLLAVNLLAVTCIAVTFRRRLLAVNLLPVTCTAVTSPSPALPSPHGRHLLAVTGTAVASSPSTSSPSPALPSPRRHRHCRRLMSVTSSPSPALPSPPRRQPPRRRLLAVATAAAQQGRLATRSSRTRAAAPPAPASDPAPHPPDLRAAAAAGAGALVRSSRGPISPGGPTGCPQVRTSYAMTPICTRSGAGACVTAAAFTPSNTEATRGWKADGARQRGYGDRGG
ncbi:hypothetical protein PLESTM_002066300, partial [Pleodorina starrii]